MDYLDLWANSLNRGLNAAIDVTVARETANLPTWTPNTNQPTGGLTLGGTTAGFDLGQLLPWLIVGAVVYAVVKMAK